MSLRKLSLIFLLVCGTVALKASTMLIPMDDKQTDHQLRLYTQSRL